MQKIEGKLTVFFDAPFWVAVCERTADGQLEVCKVTFGAEPKDAEVYEYFLKNWNHLRFSPPVTADGREAKRINPKRQQREIKKQLCATGVGTKAQQAMKLQHEEGKIARRKKSRRQREAEKERKFALKQEKKKEKHRGH